ncbi:MAG: LiaF domain-containing protein [Gemmatimonadaceae bacterium]
MPCLLWEPNEMRDSPSYSLVSYTVVPADRVPPREGMVVFWSGSVREGRWTLPRTMRVATIMGSAELDLREAEIGEGVSEIEVMAVFASVEITVPAGVRVECVGHAIMGTFELQMSGAPDFPPGAPVIRVKGTAYFSSVEVMVKPLSRKQLRAKEKLRLRGPEEDG